MGGGDAFASGLIYAMLHTGSNPLNVILNIVPSNITAVFSTNTSVLAIVFLAVSLGLCMKAVGDEKSATLKKLITEVNDIVVVFLNYVVTKFGPFAIFVLLARTFATYGINHLKPALAYVVVTVILLLLFLFVGYPIFVAATTKQNPVKFAKKIFRVAVFGFSTSCKRRTTFPVLVVKSTLRGTLMLL